MYMCIVQLYMIYYYKNQTEGGHDNLNILFLRQTNNYSYKFNNNCLLRLLFIIIAIFYNYVEYKS